MQRGKSSATSLGKSHDEGLNSLRGKKVTTPQYYHRGHTTNLCTGISDSASGSSGSPFKIMLSEGNNSRFFRRGKDGNSVSTVGGGGGLRAEKEGVVGCFGLTRGSGGGGGGAAAAFSSARHHKKYSLDNSESRAREERSRGGGVDAEVSYDIAFYHKMQHSLDELFQGKQFAKSNQMFNSKSSGDLVNSDDSFVESHGSSEFQRECFFNKSAPEHPGTPLGFKSKSRSGSLSKTADKFQYLSLNDLLGGSTSQATTTPTSNPNTATATEESCSNKDLYGDPSGGSGQYSNSSSSSSSQTTTASTSSRKNSQVSFEGSRGCSVKLPPMRSEVSPRKFEKIYNLGTVESPRVAASPIVVKGGGKQKPHKMPIFSSLWKFRNPEKRAKKGEEKATLVTNDHNNEDQEEEEEEVRDEASKYDTIYTNRHIIANRKQSADASSLFRSDSQ